MNHATFYWASEGLLVGRVGINTATFPRMVYGTQVSCVKEAFIWAEIANAATYEFIASDHNGEPKS